MTDSGQIADLRVGIDVGGTNTDAVVLDREDHVVAWSKQRTSHDVREGMTEALNAVLSGIDDPRRVGRVMLGTTAATNAIVERKQLRRVAVVRIGARATTSIPPLEGWPADLRDQICVDTVIVGGGRFVDGRLLAALDEEHLRRFLKSVAGRAQGVSITGVFSPMNPDQERRAGVIAAEELGPDIPITLSHEIGNLGLLERENVAVLNAALQDVATSVTSALTHALAARNLSPVTYFAQNDGTLMALDFASRFPVLTIGSGPANSIRGACFLSGADNAIVADIGGTTTDLGVLVDGFPRESSSAVEIGGVHTNFRMPDVVSIGVGGGTVIGGSVSAPTVGPHSVGYRLKQEALSYGGAVPTLTDAGVAAGRGQVGTTPPDKSTAGLLRAGLKRSDAMIAEAVDVISMGKTDRPIVVVGGGAFLFPRTIPGFDKIIHPDQGDVANAVGAAIALASGRWDAIIPAGPGRADAVEDACAVARRRAVQAGADPKRLEVVEIDEAAISYLPEPAFRLKVKVAGPLA